jgi:uncharacterized protein (TIGR02611 family)
MLPSHLEKPLEETNDPAVPVRQVGAAFRLARRVTVFILGMSVVLVGMVMIVAPGPAVVVIPLGLGILATEFLWARRILEALQQRLAAGHALLPDWRIFRWMRVFLPRKDRGI